MQGPNLITRVTEIILVFDQNKIYSATLTICWLSRRKKSRALFVAPVRWCYVKRRPCYTFVPRIRTRYASHPELSSEKGEHNSGYQTHMIQITGKHRYH